MALRIGPYVFILATLVIDAIGIGIVFPIMPDLMERVGAHDTAEGSIWAGVLMAAYAGAQFVFGPIVGSVSDAWGRKPVLLAALFFLAIDYVVMALAGTFWLLLIGRTLAGLAGATFITATAYISDITPREDRAARFGMIGAAFGIGFVIGPSLGGLVAAWHVTAPFWVAAVLAAANLVLGLLVLPESLPKDRRRAFGARDLNPFASFAIAWAMPGMAIPLICIGLFEFANMVYPTLWAFWGREMFGWSALVIGLSLSGYGLLAALAQVFVMPVAVARLGEGRLALCGLITALVGFMGFGLAGSVWAVALVMPLAALSDLVPPTLTALSANAADEDRQGMIQGVIASLGSLAAVIGPLVFTPVFSVFAGPDAAVRMPGAPFLLSAAIVACVLPLAYRLTRPGVQNRA